MKKKAKDLRDWEMICPKCKGTGEINENKSKNKTKDKNKKSNIVLCGKCNGVGYTDWVNNAMSKQQKNIIMNGNFEVWSRETSKNLAVEIDKEVLKNIVNQAKCRWRTPLKKGE